SSNSSRGASVREAMSFRVRSGLRENRQANRRSNHGSDSAPTPGGQRGGSPPAGPAGPFHRSSSLAGDRRLDRVDARRRSRGRQALEALVSELLDPGQAGL